MMKYLYSFLYFPMSNFILQAIDKYQVKTRVLKISVYFCLNLLTGRQLYCEDKSDKNSSVIFYSLMIETSLTPQGI